MTRSSNESISIDNHGLVCYLEGVINTTYSWIYISYNSIRKKKTLYKITPMSPLGLRNGA